MQNHKGDFARIAGMLEIMGFVGWSALPTARPANNGTVERPENDR
jgi:hypothetical protein